MPRPLQVSEFDSHPICAVSGMGCSSYFMKEKLITVEQLLRANCMLGTALSTFRSYLTSYNSPMG